MSARRTARLGAVGLVLALAGAVLPAAALAETTPIRLVLHPVGQPGAFFDLAMQPGETRRLDIQIGNDGSTPIAARTYAADVYTIVNGGFGGRLRDDATTGTTRWLTYASETIQLAVNATSSRPIIVAVPIDAAPGEYVTSIVLENDQPLVTGDATPIDQVIRQAVAVVITIAGPRVPRLGIGAAHHSVVAGHSVVAVAVKNPGNVRLAPLVDVEIFDIGGNRVSVAPIEMGTFYARTASSVELALAGLLAPGDYTVSVSMSDASQGAAASAGRIPFTVAAAAPTAPGPAVPGLVPISQGDGPPLLLVIVALLAAATLGAVGARLPWRRRP